MTDQAGVAGAGQHVVGDGPAQVGPLARVTEQRHQRLVPQVEHGLGQRAGQARREIGVHVVVGRDVEAITTRLLDERQVGAGVLAGAPLGGVVRDLDGDAALATDGEGLRDGFEDGLALPTDVRGVHRLVAAHDAAQPDELVGARVAARRVNEARGEAVGAGEKELARMERLLDAALRASSFSPAGRWARPMTASRRAPWPTSGAMLMAPPASSSALRYWRKLVQSQATPLMSQ